MDKYKTSDIGLTTALLCFKYNLLSIENHQDKEGKKIFILNKDDKISGIINQYFGRSLRIEPNSYMYNLRNLKNRMYNS